MKNMNGNEAKRFYDAIRRFLTEEWGENCAGPWWEGGLQVDFGSSLRSLGSDRVDMEDPPEFLEAWPGPIMTRRLAALEHRSRRDKAAGRRGIYPDFQYRPAGAGEGERWNIELKLWSVNGKKTLDAQVKGCIDGLEQDAKKMLSDPDKPYGLVLLAVNIPNRFGEQHVRKRKQPYIPDEFKSKLIERIRASETLKQLSTERGDWCAAIKKINGAKVEELEVHSSRPELRWPAVIR